MKNFVILCHGRSGSTFLVDALARHPDILMKTELFNRNVEKRPDVNGEKWRDGSDSWEFINRTLFSRAAAEEKMAGFKLMYFHARNNEYEGRIWERISSDPDIGVILLNRQNIFSAFLSNARAREVGVWQPGNNQERFYQECELTLDLDDMRKYLSQTMQRQIFGRNLCEKKGGFSTSYEALFADASGELEKIYTFLGVGTGPKDSFPDINEQGSSVNRENTVIKNEAEVLSVLQELGVEWMIERQ